MNASVNLVWLSNAPTAIGLHQCKNNKKARASGAEPSGCLCSGGGQHRVQGGISGDNQWELVGFGGGGGGGGGGWWDAGVEGKLEDCNKEEREGELNRVGID